MADRPLGGAHPVLVGQVLRCQEGSSRQPVTPMEQDIRGVGADLLDVEVGREGQGQVTPVVHERQVGGASGDLLDRVMGVMFEDGDLEPGVALPQLPQGRGDQATHCC